MKKAFIILSIWALAFAGCRRSDSPRPDTIPLVKALSADTTGLFRSGGPSGTIVILGAPADVAVTSRLFSQMDAEDNIDGRPVPDQLPDFSGERFIAVIDTLFRPDTTARERVVVQAWTAAKVSSGIAPKLYVLSTDGLSGFDLDTLYKMCGSRIPVIQAPDSLARVKETARLLRRENLYSHRIAYPEVLTTLADVSVVD